MNMNNNEIVTPKLTLFHPNAKGTGSVIQFELKPAHGMESGAIYCRIAKQATIGDCNANPPTYPTFDWKKTITTSFGFKAIGNLLMVLRGEAETVNGDDGITYFKKNGYVTIKFTHQVEPVQGYIMNFTESVNLNSDTDINMDFVFTPAEALALMKTFEGALVQIAFGTGYEATSIAIARDEAIAAQATDIATTEAKKERMEADKQKVDKAFAKSMAVGMLCAYYGKENVNAITEAVDRACGDNQDDPYAKSTITEEERKLGLDALGEDHPIWKYVI